MPAPIDRDKREQQITDAAMRLLSERGPSALTLRALAAELGGSMTLVTHVYANRAEMLRGITERTVAGYDEEIRQLEQGASDRERLRLLLEWMLPLAADDRRRELSRVMLVGEREAEPAVSAFFVAMDRKMRQLLAGHLKPLVPADEVQPTVELLRVLVNGVVLASAEHPTKWPRKRQLALLDRTLRLLELA